MSRYVVPFARKGGAACDKPQSLTVSICMVFNVELRVQLKIFVNSNPVSMFGAIKGIRPRRDNLARWAAMGCTCMTTTITPDSSRESQRPVLDFRKGAKEGNGAKMGLEAVASRQVGSSEMVATGGGQRASLGWLGWDGMGRICVCMTLMSGSMLDRRCTRFARFVLSACSPCPPTPHYIVV